MSILPNINILFHEIPSRKWFKKTLQNIGMFWRFISIDDIKSYYSGSINLRKSCHISFDDGELSFYNYAFPVLKELNIPASLFVSPSIIKSQSNFWFQDIEYLKSKINEKSLKKHICEKFNLNYSEFMNYEIMSIMKCLKVKDILSFIHYVKNKYDINNEKCKNINIEQLIEIHNSKIVVIGAHTCNHPILLNEDDITSKNEIENSIGQLSEILNKKIEYFAFPNGQTGLDISNRELKILKDYNVSLSFTTDSTYFNKNNNVLELPRMTLSGSKRENQFYILLKIILLPLRKIKEKLFTTQNNERLELINLINESNICWIQVVSATLYDSPKNT